MLFLHQLTKLHDADNRRSAHRGQRAVAFATGEQLQETAKGEKIQLPSEMTAEDKAAYDRLDKLSRAEFDRAYMQMMVKDHEEDVAEFKREASAGKNKALKDFAEQTLPTLEDHLKEAREVATSHRASM